MSAPYKDYYKILGVDRSATAAEIKAAFRKAARKYHPDLHEKSDKAAAEEKFKEMNEAFAVLSDSEKRSQYDMLGSNMQNGQEWQTSPGTGGFDSRSWSQVDSSQVDSEGFSDFFETLFGSQMNEMNRGGSRRTRSVRGQDLESTLELTLEEAYRGGHKSIKFTLESLCPVCGGTGAANQRICQRCAGTGSKVVGKSLEVNIPPFTRSGSKIRLKGQGAQGPVGGKPGDLLLTITILPNAVFSLSGSDLETIIVIRPEQAVLGCKVSVPTMDGKVILTMPPMFHSGKKLRLRSKGWLEKNGSRGDEIVKVMIDIPRTMSSAEKKIYQSLADHARETRREPYGS